MANAINQQTGMALAYWGYTPPTDVNQQVLRLPEGWDIQNLSDHLGSDWNVQRNGFRNIENQFQVIANRDERQIAISFKGSDAASNWTSDIANAGAAEFAKIERQAQAALDALRADPNYAGYTFFAAGHSLGGGMGQSFAVRNGLDAYVYNSLPIAQGTIDGTYYGGAAGFAAARAQWAANGHAAYDVRTPNDIATFFFSTTNAGVYLSGSPIVLPGVALPDAAKTILLGSILAGAAAGPIGLAVMGLDHTMGALRDASTGLGLDDQGRYLTPDGANVFSQIPVSVRGQWGLLSASPVVAVAQNGNAWIIDRQDGSRQWAAVDSNDNATLRTLADSTGSTELSFRLVDVAAGITITHRNTDSVVDQIRTIRTDRVTGANIDQTRSLYPDSSVHLLTTVTAATDGSNTSVVDIYDEGGQKVADTWRNSDGTYGSDSFNSIDGSVNGIAYNANGSYTTFSRDGQGNVDASLYDAQGNVIGGQCRTIVESAVQAFTPDAASPSATLNAFRSVAGMQEDEARAAHVIRGFAGLETPPGESASVVPDDASSADPTWFRTLGAIAGPDRWSSPTGSNAWELLGLAAAGGTSGGTSANLDWRDWYADDTGWNFRTGNGLNWDVTLVDPAVGRYSNYAHHSSYDDRLNFRPAVASSPVTVTASNDRVMVYWTWYYNDWSWSFGGLGPVLLDLDGDGIELVPAASSTAWYDLAGNGDGARFHCGWGGRTTACSPSTTTAMAKSVPGGRWRSASTPKTLPTTPTCRRWPPSSIPTTMAGWIKPTRASPTFGSGATATATASRTPAKWPPWPRPGSLRWASTAWPWITKAAATGSSAIPAISATTTAAAGRATCTSAMKAKGCPPAWKTATGA